MQPNHASRVNVSHQQRLSVLDVAKNSSSMAGKGVVRLAESGDQLLNKIRGTMLVSMTVTAYE
jgi:hypothetical protein